MIRSNQDGDALNRWKRMRVAVEAANSACGKRHGDDPWEHRAARFDRMGRQRQDQDSVLRALSDRVHASDVVLDIGAGAGRHAVPLARHAAQLVAVEPSAAMRSRLEARVAEEKVTNIAVIPAAWPMAAPVACDVACSIHVLYGVDDVASFVDAMTRSARRECVLVLDVSAPADVVNRLWRVVHGRRHPPRPAAHEAFDVLRQFGFSASFQVLPGSGHVFEIADTDEDIDEMCIRLGIQADTAGRACMRRALERFRTPAADGGFVLGATSPHALIAWPGTNS